MTTDDERRILILKAKSYTRYSDKRSAVPMSSQTHNNQDLHFDADFFQQNLPQHYRSVLSSFQEISRSFILFHIVFLSTIAIEMTTLIGCLSIFNQSVLLAAGLGALFLTIFSYLILLFYQQAKKPEQLQSLLNNFLNSCKSTIGLPEGIAQHHLSIAGTLLKLSSYLQDREWEFSRLYLLRPISKLAKESYKRDVFRLQQLLLHAAVDEHLKQIRITPTDLEVHASLAGTYINLSQLYKAPKTTDGLYAKHEMIFDEKFKIASSLAIEEFEILSQYAPNDPWIHEQLAEGYRNLDLFDKEIQEVEILLQLKPHDRDILHRLGTLYFAQNFNAKGLKIYEELKQSNFKRAEELIASYGKATHAQNLAPIGF